MKVVDLNVLLYAVNSDSVHHTVVTGYWNRIASGEEEIGFSWNVLLGFLRLSTNQAVFPRPLDPKAAIRKIDEWLSLPPARVVTETEEHWPILRRLLDASGMAGPTIWAARRISSQVLTRMSRSSATCPALSSFHGAVRSR